MTGQAFTAAPPVAAQGAGRGAADPPSAPFQAVPNRAMTVTAVIRLCLERSQAEGWDPRRQRELAFRVVGRLRPEWSDSQISDAIDRAAGGTPGDPAAPVDS